MHCNRLRHSYTDYCPKMSLYMDSYSKIQAWVQVISVDLHGDALNSEKQAQVMSVICGIGFKQSSIVALNPNAAEPKTRDAWE